jgi:hypothetical protein
MSVNDLNYRGRSYGGQLGSRIVSPERGRSSFRKKGRKKRHVPFLAPQTARSLQNACRLNGLRKCKCHSGRSSFPETSCVPSLNPRRLKAILAPTSTFTFDEAAICACRFWIVPNEIAAALSILLPCERCSAIYPSVDVIGWRIV